MAISTDASIDFFGTQDIVTSSSSSVADAAFSVTADIVTWTNDDGAPQASITLEATYSVAPDANSSADLYGRLMNVRGTNDQDIPDANFQHVYLGSFPLNDVTSLQPITIDIPLPNFKASPEYEFYIQNNAGQTLSAGWDLYITPKTSGPHA
jgi:hypothetical protein